MADSNPFVVTDENNTVTLGQLFQLNKENTAVLTSGNVAIKYTGSWHRHTPKGGLGYIDLIVTHNGEPEDMRQRVHEQESVTFQLTDQYSATVFDHKYDSSITLKIN